MPPAKRILRNLKLPDSPDYDSAAILQPYKKEQKMASDSTGVHVGREEENRR
jgi:hypothetical protein